MTCYNPVLGFYGKPNADGKRPVVFKESEADRSYIKQSVSLPCGHCVGCRIDRASQWAVRCVHEASLWKDNCFITLTYNDENLPKDGSVDVREWQLFMKKLRNIKSGVRFFHCGEYGAELGRPHYHACLFNYDFPDRELFSTRGDTKIYTSSLLDGLWGKGFCTVGDVSFQSAAYVARYVMKKVYGDEAVDHYRGRKPEYITMSRKPGIGHDYYRKFKSDMFPRDYVVHDGKRLTVPRYYAKLLEKDDVDTFETVVAGRFISTPRFVKVDNKDGKEIMLNDNCPERLAVRQEIKEAQLTKLVRRLEE